MSESTQFDWRYVLKIGLLAGILAFSVSVIGMVEAFSQRDLISGVVALGHLLLFASAIGLGYYAAGQAGSSGRQNKLLIGAIIGLLASPLLVILIFLAATFDLRAFGLVNVSPNLIEELLTFGQTPATGSLILVLLSTGMGLLGAAIHYIPARSRSLLLIGLTWTLGIGMMSEVLTSVLRPLVGNQGIKFLFKAKALTPWAAALVFVLVIVITLWWRNRSHDIRRRLAGYLPEDPNQRRTWTMVAAVVALLLLPQIVGTYLSEVINNVGLYVLMGLGLNIVIGFAGLLDLGYVAFFAIGAYTMGVLTSQGDLGVSAGFTFWTALPIAVAVSVLAGIILGIPVLGMRGDYLAIVTLGFGEIIRIMATSDFLKPTIGGAQGILQIPKAQVGNLELVAPQSLYYLILAGCVLAVFVSTRLRDSRMGRQWMAMREDEDVAEAMGIDLVKTKLMAFASGAAFSGLSGAIFASKLSSIFPHSFNLIISINVLCLIIVGGMGSLPGVVVGALALVGLPELLREFVEYRFLMYGVLLIVMMLARPEGLWPSAVRQRELHVEEIEAVAAD
jgi:branched-chain amino acid transport system permease protein